MARSNFLDYILCLSDPFLSGAIIDLLWGFLAKKGGTSKISIAAQPQICSVVDSLLAASGDLSSFHKVMLPLVVRELIFQQKIPSPAKLRLQATQYSMWSSTKTAIPSLASLINSSACEITAVSLLAGGTGGSTKTKNNHPRQSQKQVEHGLRKEERDALEDTFTEYLNQKTNDLQMTTTRARILAKVFERINQVTTSTIGIRCFLFGSAASGFATRGSDMDVVVPLTSVISDGLIKHASAARNAGFRDETSFPAWRLRRRSVKRYHRNKNKTSASGSKKGNKASEEQPTVPPPPVPPPPAAPAPFRSEPLAPISGEPVPPPPAEGPIPPPPTTAVDGQSRKSGRWMRVGEDLKKKKQETEVQHSVEDGVEWIALEETAYDEEHFVRAGGDTANSLVVERDPSASRCGGRVTETTYLGTRPIWVRRRCGTETALFDERQQYPDCDSEHDVASHLPTPIPTTDASNVTSAFDGSVETKTKAEDTTANADEPGQAQGGCEVGTWAWLDGSEKLRKTAGIWAGRWLAKRLHEEGWVVECVEGAAVPVVRIKACVDEDGNLRPVPKSLRGERTSKIPTCDLQSVWDYSTSELRQLKKLRSRMRADTSSGGGGLEGSLVVDDKDVPSLSRELRKTATSISTGWCVENDDDVDEGGKGTKELTAAPPVAKSRSARVTLVNVDLSFNKEVVIHNTRIMRSYCQFDKRAKQLGLLVKHWAKKRDISSSYVGTLSGYQWLLLVIHYLQHCVVPRKLPAAELGGSNGSDVQYLPVLPNLQRPPVEIRRRLAGRVPVEHFCAHREKMLDSLDPLKERNFGHWGEDMQSCITPILTKKRRRGGNDNGSKRTGMIWPADPWAGRWSQTRLGMTGGSHIAGSLDFYGEESSGVDDASDSVSDWTSCDDDVVDEKKKPETAKGEIDGRSDGGGIPPETNTDRSKMTGFGSQNLVSVDVPLCRRRLRCSLESKTFRQKLRAWADGGEHDVFFYDAAHGANRPLAAADVTAPGYAERCAWLDNRTGGAINNMTRTSSESSAADRPVCAGGIVGSSDNTLLEERGGGGVCASCGSHAAERRPGSRRVCGAGCTLWPEEGQPEAYQYALMALTAGIDNKPLPDTSPSSSSLAASDRGFGSRGDRESSSSAGEKDQMSKTDELDRRELETRKFKLCKYSRPLHARQLHALRKECTVFANRVEHDGEGLASIDADERFSWIGDESFNKFVYPCKHTGTVRASREKGIKRNETGQKPAEGERGEDFDSLISLELFEGFFRYFALHFPFYSHVFAINRTPNLPQRKVAFFSDDCRGIPHSSLRCRRRKANKDFLFGANRQSTTPNEASASSTTGSVPPVKQKKDGRGKRNEGKEADHDLADDEFLDNGDGNEQPIIEEEDDNDGEEDNVDESAVDGERDADSESVASEKTGAGKRVIGHSRDLADFRNRMQFCIGDPFEQNRAIGPSFREGMVQMLHEFYRSVKIFLDLREKIDHINVSSRAAPKGQLIRKACIAALDSLFEPDTKEPFMCPSPALSFPHPAPFQSNIYLTDLLKGRTLVKQKSYACGCLDNLLGSTTATATVKPTNPAGDVSAAGGIIRTSGVAIDAAAALIETPGDSELQDQFSESMSGDVSPESGLMQRRPVEVYCPNRDRCQCCTVFFRDFSSLQVGFNRSLEIRTPAPPRGPVGHSLDGNWRNPSDVPQYQQQNPRPTYRPVDQCRPTMPSTDGAGPAYKKVDRQGAPPIPTSQRATSGNIDGSRTASEQKNLVVHQHPHQGPLQHPHHHPAVESISTISTTRTPTTTNSTSTLTGVETKISSAVEICRPVEEFNNRAVVSGAQYSRHYPSSVQEERVTRTGSLDDPAIQQVVLFETPTGAYPHEHPQHHYQQQQQRQQQHQHQQRQQQHHQLRQQQHHQPQHQQQHQQQHQHQQQQQHPQHHYQQHQQQHQHQRQHQQQHQQHHYQHQLERHQQHHQFQQHHQHHQYHQYRQEVPQQQAQQLYQRHHYHPAPQSSWQPVIGQPPSGNPSGYRHVANGSGYLSGYLGGYGGSVNFRGGVFRHQTGHPHGMQGGRGGSRGGRGGW